MNHNIILIRGITDIIPDIPALQSSSASDFIAVQKGDEIVVQLNSFAARKGRMLADILKAGGVALATYQTTQLMDGKNPSGTGGQY